MTPLSFIPVQRATMPETGAYQAERKTEKTEERLPTAVLPQFANDWAAGGAATQPRSDASDLYFAQQQSLV